jgi:hypothetical protein
VSHLDNAKRLLEIAESGDAKKEAYKAATEEIAAHQAETGDDIKTTAEKLQFPGVSLKSAQVKVGKYLAWRKRGYDTDSPYDEGTEKRQQTRARVSHAKRALTTPEELKSVIESLTPAQQAAVRTEFEDEEARQAKRRFRQAKEQQDQARPSTTVTEFFWQIIKGLDNVTRDLAFVSEELSLLSDGQKPEVRQRLVRLRDQAQASIDVLDDKEPSDNTVDGHAVDVIRELAS